jgi:hypothetical protein
MVQVWKAFSLSKTYGGSLAHALAIFRCVLDHQQFVRLVKRERHTFYGNFAPISCDRVLTLSTPLHCETSRCADILDAGF